MVGLADDGFRRQVEKAGCLRVAVEIDAVRILQPDHVGQGAQQGAQPAAFRFDARLFVAPGGNVDEHTGRDARAAIRGVFDDAAPVFHPQPVSVAVADAVVDTTHWQNLAIFRVDRSMQQLAVFRMQAFQPVGQGAWRFAGGAAKHPEHPVAHDHVVAFVLVFPAACLRCIQGHLQVGFKAQTVALLLRFVQCGFKLVEGELLEQAVLADDPDNVASVIGDRHVAQAMVNHFLQRRSDRFAGLDAAHRRTHRLAQGHVVRLGRFLEQSRNVAFGQDADGLAVFADDQIVRRVSEHFGQCIAQCGLWREQGNATVHDAFQRAQLAEHGNAQRHAKIGFADQAECFAVVVDNDQVPDMMAVDQLPGLEQIKIRARSDQRMGHEGRYGRFARQAGVQCTQDVALGDDACRASAIADEQAGNVLAGHCPCRLVECGLRCDMTHVAGHDVGKRG